MTRPVEQRFVFDEVAELYDRTRPRYPDALIDDLVSHSRVPAEGRILEIGCGTGQLTASLAARGFRITCLEPGASMAALARQRLARFPEVEVQSLTFEAWPLAAGAFDLVVSAQAFHWVDPAVRFAKSGDSLRPGGSLAVIGNVPVEEASPARSEIDAAYETHAPGLAANRMPACWYAENALIRGLFDASGRFAEVAAFRRPWAESYSAERYLDLMRTHSPHRLLPEAQRESLLSAVGEAIARHGGSFEVRYEARMYLARVL